MEELLHGYRNSQQVGSVIHMIDQMKVKNRGAQLAECSGGRDGFAPHQKLPLRPLWPEHGTDLRGLDERQQGVL
jgi:hypothetical protein